MNSSKSSRISEDSIEQALSWIRSLQGSVCILTHKNADPDAVASALALNYLIMYLAPNEVRVSLIAPEGLEAVSKRVIDELNLTDFIGVKCVSKGELDCMYQVIIDTASASQLGEFSGVLRDFMVIDHHEVNNLIDSASTLLYDPGRKSSSEIVFMVIDYLIRKSDLSVPKEILTALIAGILYDTKYLKLADDVTFEIMAKLLRLGGEYTRAIAILSSKKRLDYSERIARIKGAMRAGLYKVNDLIMVITCVGAYESSVLKVLLDAGADVALAISTRKNRGTRIIIRATNEAVDRLGFPLAAELAQELGKQMGGSGGGHASAAGAYVEEFSPKSFIKVLAGFFRSRNINFKTIDEGRWLSECGG
ncbi:MAG: DHH family phosphoesterase [Desulfurococcales archaeon]|nr:DHH family phosphoesterase [Desulfurococcales archaeon]